MWFIFTLAVLDFLRGRDWKYRPPKAILYGIGGASFGLYYLLSGASSEAAILLGVVGFLGLWLGYSIGWGKYFAAFTGRYNPKEKDFFPADCVADWVYKKTKDGYLAGWIGMSIRHMLFSPLMLGIALITHDPHMVLSAVFCFSGGFVYAAMRFIPEKYAVLIAEPLRGALIASLMIGA